MTHRSCQSRPGLAHPLAGRAARLVSPDARRALLALGVAVLSSHPVRAATLVVNSPADPAGFNPNVTIATLGAAVTLRDAVNAANNTPGDDAIQFDASLAGQRIDLERVGDATVGSSALRISSTVSIVAPSGGLTIGRSGGIGTLRLFYVDSAGQLTLNGVEVRDGAETNGGAVYNQGTLTCTGAAFRVNSAKSRGVGGAVYNTGSGIFSATFTTFQGNQAEAAGGALYNDSASDSSASIANSFFGNNYAIGYVLGGNSFRSDGRAGAIYNAGKMTITNTELGGNLGNVDGGAIQNTATGNLTINDSFLDLNGKNIFSVMAFYGGAIRNFGALVVSGSTFHQNSADNRGGAISTEGGAAATRIVNSTFQGNAANFGAALSAHGGAPVEVVHCTIAQNGSSNFYALWAETGAVVTVTNSILWNPDTPNEFGVFNGTFNRSHNIVRGTDPDPRLTSFGGANSGPPVGIGQNPMPMFGIQPGSPAINAAEVIAGITTDQRGVSRPQGSAPDIGAYEFAEAPSLVVSTVSDVSGADGVTSLREAVAYAATLDGPRTITFAPALTAGGPAVVTLERAWSGADEGSALLIGTDMTLQGPDSGHGITITMAEGVRKRHVLVTAPGKVTLSRLAFTNGYAADLGGKGGSIENFGAVTVRSCTFAGNTAETEGGAIHSAGGSPSLTIENSTFTGNSAGTMGSAIVTGAVNTTLRYATITGNTGPNGPLWLYNTVATMVNTIVAGNSTDGVETHGTGAFSPESANNILGAGGSAGLANGVNGNLVGVPAAALRLGALADNGGQTPTIAPLPGSPAVNSGLVITGLDRDQRGLPRAAGSAPDIGAVEDQSGNDDPDGDALTNVAELGLGSDPLSIDTDNDGFNDATEMLNATDPASDASVPPPTHVERVLGFGPARGLDLHGDFVYAVNIGTAGAAGQAGDADFTPDDVAGVTVSATSEIPVWNTPDFGPGDENHALALVYQSIRWANHLSEDPEDRKLKVDLANLVPGGRYRLQLLFGEGGAAGRRFDVSVNGSLVVDDFAPALAQGSPFCTVAGSAVVYDFQAPTSTVSIVLDGTDVAAVPDLNQDPYLNGLTLEAVSMPITAADAARALSIAGGLTEATGGDARLDIDGDEGISAVDAVGLIRAAAGSQP